MRNKAQATHLYTQDNDHNKNMLFNKALDHLNNNDKNKAKALFEELANMHNHRPSQYYLIVIE